jgi:hypothetical protein
MTEVQKENPTKPTEFFAVLTIESGPETGKTRVISALSRKDLLKQLNELQIQSDFLIHYGVKGKRFETTTKKAFELHL